MRACCLCALIVSYANRARSGAAFITPSGHVGNFKRPFKSLRFSGAWICCLKKNEKGHQIRNEKAPNH